MAVFVLSFQSAFAAAAGKDNKVETLSEVSIIGNTELPNVNFNMTWKLPSVEKRDDQFPPKEISGVLVPIEPKRYKQQIHFSRFLEVDAPSFIVR
jgi:hypothetical protein